MHGHRTGTEGELHPRLGVRRPERHLPELHGKMLRIGHTGHIAQPMYVIVALSALERTLHDHGFPLRFGDGVGAALAAMDGTAPGG